jgi:hypothetical protein
VDASTTRVAINGIASLLGEVETTAALAAFVFTDSMPFSAFALVSYPGSQR